MIGNSVKDKILINNMSKSDKLNQIIEKYTKISKELNLITPPDVFTYSAERKMLTFVEARTMWEKALDNKLVRESIDMYVGIPYCEGANRCSYCMYYSKVSPTNEEINIYLSKINKMFASYRELFEDVKLNSLYVGGGTPNILTISQMNKLLNDIFSTFEFKEGVEMTYENSPHLYSYEKMNLLNSFGINRISFGLQSFDEKVLKVNNRKFIKPRDMKIIIDETMKFNFKQVNVDLMLGIEGQTLESAIESFQILAEMQPTTITVYVNRLLKNKFSGIENKDSFIKQYYNDMIYPALTEIYELASQYGYINKEKDVTLEYQRFNRKDRGGFSSNYNTRRNMKKNNSCLGFGSNSYSYICSNHRTVTYKTIKDPDELDLDGEILDSKIIEQKDLMRLYVLSEFYQHKKLDLNVFEKIFNRNFVEEFRFEILCLIALNRLNINRNEVSIICENNKEFAIYSKFFYSPEQIDGHTKELALLDSGGSEICG